jgi:hypothetical protein
MSLFKICIFSSAGIFALNLIFFKKTTLKYGQIFFFFGGTGV